MNIVTDSPPALALAMDPMDPDTMKRPPRRPKQQILTWQSSTELILTGLVIALVTLGVFARIPCRRSGPGGKGRDHGVLGHRHLPVIHRPRLQRFAGEISYQNRHVQESLALGCRRVRAGYAVPYHGMGSSPCCLRDGPARAC